ncbi:MAG: hypothetical protein FI735_10465 [SAR202 cluster bacterium]|nr:hypothetical protein [SAR202 cluster bacterium]
MCGTTEPELNSWDLLENVSVHFPTHHDLSSFEDPEAYPVGIKYVLVNGRVAVDQERCTGTLAGRAIP